MMQIKPFQNRKEAGQRLAKKLAQYALKPPPIVLALPRGGVPVAFEIAKTLDAPLDVYVVRKLGVPGNPELAMGAIASGGAFVLNKETIDMFQVDKHAIREVAKQESLELARRERLYRGDEPPLSLSDRTVILVDDGLATGSTMRAAVAAIREQTPRKIVVAVPISSPDTCDEMQRVADDVICAETPLPFRAVGLWYKDFSQTSDDEVRSLLAEARKKSWRERASVPSTVESRR